MPHETINKSHSFTTTAADAGQRLDRVLTARLPEFSRSRLQGLIKSGHVLLSGKTARPKDSVPQGAQITIQIPPDVPAEALPQKIPLSILYEDSDLAIIDKAHGMVVHPASGNPDGTLVNALLHHFGALSSIGGVTRPGIVHRLDKDTSGCMVVARNDQAHEHIAKQFAERTNTKTYLCITTGIPEKISGTITTIIGRSPHNRQKMAVLPDSARTGKNAITSYKVLATLGTTALIRCDLHTGRTHQIRVHMKHLVAPLLGDPIYGKPSLETNRLMLHAWRLGITHPKTNNPLAFEAPIPNEFENWLKTADLPS